MNEFYSNLKIKVVVNTEVRKAALAKGINRDVNLANAKKIMADIEKRGYRQAEQIQVIPAEEVIANGDITLVDINGKPISAADANQYYLVVDGQHRVFAVALYDEKYPDKKITIPAVIVTLGEDETIAEYISAINVTKNEWKPLDYVRGAANVLKDQMLLQRYNELIKCDNNPDGFSLSTLNIIFCENSKALNKTDLSLLCHGKTEKGVKVRKSILPSYNLERGNRFIDLCLKKGFTMKDIAPRYLAEQFKNYKTEKSEEEAFELFESINPNHRTAMYNEKGKIDENKVIAQFKEIKDSIVK